jgi:hypothetical protein
VPALKALEEEYAGKLRVAFKVVAGGARAGG